MRFLRSQVNCATLLIALLIIPAALSCAAVGDGPSTPASKSVSSSSEPQQGCGGLDEEVEEWERSEKLRLEEDVVVLRLTMLEVSERLEQIEADAKIMSRELLEECQAEAKDPLPAGRDSAETESAQGRLLPTPTSTSTPRTATVVPTPTRVPTPTPRPSNTPSPTSLPASTPTPMSVLIPAPVPDGVPLVAAFLDVPASHNGGDAIQFQLLFTEPVSTSYKVLRDAAIQAVNGTVKESKRVDKRNDLWMVTVEPEGAKDMVITLTAPPDCGDDAAVCTGSGKALSNSPIVRVPYRR